ncbi:MAG: lytic murein transglycosylase B [Candidatus Eutrophobiaceae bacterium]
MLRFLSLFIVLALSLGVVQANNFYMQDDVQIFLQKMHKKHGISMTELQFWFRQVEVKQSILTAISRPAEKKEWHQYRPIFLGSSRIKQGVKFWRTHQETLERAAHSYGVPAQIIVAIIGVETNYGRNTGSYRVIDALATLGFNYPKRATFFLSELEQYLLMTREQGIDPMSLKGSYAGAMGLPQFISSSYRNYAVDFSSDGRADIFSNPVDAIGSVGNYFARHGWVPDGKVAFLATAKGMGYKTMLQKDLKPVTRFAQLAAHGVSLEQSVPADAVARLLELRLKQGSELWVTLHNFYVITRYNHSALYAMAVFQLAQEIEKRFQAEEERQ